MAVYLEELIRNDKSVKQFTNQLLWDIEHKGGVCKCVVLDTAVRNHDL